MSNITAIIDNLRGTCGVSLASNFYDYGDRPIPDWSRLSSLETTRSTGGCGWQVAGFISTKACQKAYEILKNKNLIVFQSPVRRNNNSGRNFFFVAYDTRVGRKSKNNPEGKFNPEKNSAHAWPFKKVSDY
jgi:hypothetical protein